MPHFSQNIKYQSFKDGKQGTTCRLFAFFKVKLPYFGCQLQESGCQNKESACQLQESGRQHKESACQLKESERQLQESGRQNKEAGNHFNVLQPHFQLKIFLTKDGFLRLHIIHLHFADIFGGHLAPVFAAEFVFHQLEGRI